MGNRSSITYDQAPLAKALIKRKMPAKLTTDMKRLSTLNILRYLYKRHRAELWITGFWLVIACNIWIKLG